VVEQKQDRAGFWNGRVRILNSVECVNWIDSTRTADQSTRWMSFRPKCEPGHRGSACGPPPDFMFPNMHYARGRLRLTAKQARQER
jgi:hypothetical protein